ncbi:RHS repeat-associated core domain-containing protein [Flavobacterium sp. LS1P28]|nr:RHS repeat-associated core domain-containing protein [Flavobacterium sp. LS1P28]
MEYQTNIAGEVKLYLVALSFANNTYTPTLSVSTVNNGFYSPNELYKTITKHENWTSGKNNTTEEFKDKEGRVILKRTYSNYTNTLGVITAPEVSHDTYYIYDIYGNLTYVIPPLANGAFDATTLSNLCYQYKYDYRNRLVEKKLPGKQWEYIVYDKLDRVVATGPALSPFNDLGQTNGWMIIKYDVFNRPVLTAWMQAAVSSADRTALQNSHNAITTTFSETKNATTDTMINGVSFRYSNVAWPTSGYHVLTVSYFDDYNYLNAPAIPATIETQDVYYNNKVKPKGLPTGSWTRVLQASTQYANELAYSLYDLKGRPIRSYTSNFLGGYTYIDSKLDFTGKPEYNTTYHKRLFSDSELMIKEVFTYSPQGRLLTQNHQIGTLTAELLVSNEYDELGQLKAKEVGAKTQRIDYSYNIRGWLTEINKVAALQQGTDPKDLFAFKINYNILSSGIEGVSALYNGNIAETHWTTSTDNVLRTYGYKYDAINRLSEALYKKGSVVNAYDEKLTYDANGNIKTLLRYGSLNDATPVLIDDLAYDYKSTASNQLMKVTDVKVNNGSFINEFKDSASNTVDDYDYDANGNMIKDNNKNITAITYNHLNLPTKITFGTTGFPNINYIYNSIGKKLQKTIRTYNSKNQTTTTVDTYYLDGFQYKSTGSTSPTARTIPLTILEFFPTSEGYVESIGSSYKYVYQYKDHLGNIRVSYDKSLTIQEENNYYPFGLKHAGYGNTISSTNGALKYKYNGKELQDELGLNFYDYGARNYDPAIGRWMNVDPLAEKMLNWSAYSYAFNNPMRFTDPTGMEPDDFVQRKDGSIYWDNNANSQATTKSGETYLGKGLTFNFNSYIGSNYDGPLGSLPEGNKLTSTISVTGNENSKGELTSISAAKNVELGKTFGLFQGRDYYPGLGEGQNKFSLSSSKSGINLNFEQHASVPKMEEIGLNMTGNNIVNVAQKLNLNYFGGNLSVKASTDIFPSATLSVNGNQLMNYTQPSFTGTHSLPSIGKTPATSSGTGGNTIYNYSYKPAVFYDRYSH